MWLCVFYNGAPGLGPGLLLCHTRLPHTFIHTRGLICASAPLTVIHKQEDCQNMCILGALLSTDVTQNAETWIWSCEHVCAQRGISVENVQQDEVFFFFQTNGQFIRAAELQTPSLWKASNACWRQPSALYVWFCLSCITDPLRFVRWSYFILWEPARETKPLNPVSIYHFRIWWTWELEERFTWIMKKKYIYNITPTSSSFKTLGFGGFFYFLRFLNICHWYFCFLTTMTGVDQASLVITVYSNASSTVKLQFYADYFCSCAFYLS